MALHPAARALRQKVGTVARSNTIWVDVQALTDPMNFYKSDPVRDLGMPMAHRLFLSGFDFAASFAMRHTRLFAMIFSGCTASLSFGVERRTHYSWHAILCGPEQFADIADEGGAALASDLLLFHSNCLNLPHHDFTCVRRKGRLGPYVAGWYLLRRPFDRRARRASLDNRPEEGRRYHPTCHLCHGPWRHPVDLCCDRPAAFSVVPGEPFTFCRGNMRRCHRTRAHFRLTHKALGQMWSVSLQLKQDHKLITTGIYKYLRHPMYTAFWLMALTQALLLPNYVAGLAGVVGFGFLFFSRIGPEEAMMEEAFGEEYHRYRARTWRVLPYLY